MRRTLKRSVPKQAEGVKGAAIAAVWVETSAVLLLISAPALAWIACRLLWGSDYLEHNKRYHMLFHLQCSIECYLNIVQMRNKKFHYKLCYPLDNKLHQRDKYQNHNM